MTDADWKAAYDAFTDQIEREDTLYQTRTNFDFGMNGALLVFYGVVLGADKAIQLPLIRILFLLLICAIGFGTSYMFERLIDRSYQQLKVLKRSYCDNGVAAWAADKRLPRPFLDEASYTDYPFTEMTMYLFAFWSLLAAATIIFLLSALSWTAPVSLGNSHG